jgi:hypothetical protein
MVIIRGSYGKFKLNSHSCKQRGNLIIRISIHIRNKCSQTGVDKLALLIKQGVWSEEAGALTVWPAAADWKQFEECLPHFLSTRVVEQSFYSKDMGAGEQCIWLQCASQRRYIQGLIIYLCC